MCQINRSIPAWWKELWKAKPEEEGVSHGGRGCQSLLDPWWWVRRLVCWEMEKTGWVKSKTEREVEDSEKFSFTENVQLCVSVSLWVFVNSAPASHLHESWLLSSSENDERREACLSACLHITNLVGKSFFFTGCSPGTHILHLFHLFMTSLWPQTYATPRGAGKKSF